MPKPGNHWRYQLVYEQHDDERSYGVVECYFTNAGKVRMWTANMVAPYGETQEEFLNVLEMMRNDAVDFEPIAMADMKVGMSIKRVAKIKPEPPPSRQVKGTH